MSLNFVEALLDKLPFSSLNGREIFPRKFSGSQNLMDTNSRMSFDMIAEYHHLFDAANVAPNASVMNFSTGAKNNFQNFEAFSDSLVSRVPKLLSPSFSILQGILSSQPELLFGSPLILNDRCNLIHEPLDQLDLFKISRLDIEKPQQTSKMPENPVNVLPARDTGAKLAADVTQNSTPADDNAGLLKLNVDSCHTLKQELINRKEKELKKRSKKRQRRQKKSNALNSQKQIPVENSKKPIITKKCVSPSRLSQSPISESIGVNCDILCDIVSITGQANGVQIIVPDLPSFVISVGSGDEDDADWDACSDSEWLTECPEFELSGLFVANLSAPKISHCPAKKSVSHHNSPPNQDDKEAHKLQRMILNVNKSWNETMRDLERKPKLPSKVSFAPVNELVRVLSVENYERKGEWETFALERMRFKKRIDELDSVLSPCLSKEHREKVFQKMHQTHS